MDKKPTTRAAIREANTEVLIHAALRAFARHGYDDTTIRDIVEESGLSRGTFYNYLGDKPTAIRVVTERLVEDVQEAVRAARREADSIEALVQDAFAAMIRVMTEDPYRLAFTKMNGMVLRSIVGDLEIIHTVTLELAQDLDRAIAAGYLPPQRTSWIAAAMVGAAIELITRLGPDDDHEEAARFLADLFLNGLRSE